MLLNDSDKIYVPRHKAINTESPQSFLLWGYIVKILLSEIHK